MALDVKIQGMGFVLAVLARGEAEVRKRLTGALRDTGREFTKDYQKNHLKGGGPDSLARRSGNLARAFNFRVQGNRLPDLGMVLGFGPPAVAGWPGGSERYARTHLEGRTITPKRGKFLAVPVDQGLTSSGIPRFASLRDVPDIDFVPHLFKSGMGYLAIQRQTTAKGGFRPGKLMALLLKKVTIPKRLDLEATWLARGAPVLLRRMGDAMDGAVEGMTGGGGPRG